jgi:hypothetical protein
MSDQGSTETAEAIAATADKDDARTAAAYAIKAALDDRLTGGGVFAQLSTVKFGNYIKDCLEELMFAELKRELMFVEKKR